jgi:fatty-acyl-CoA synthase
VPTIWLAVQPLLLEAQRKAGGALPQLRHLRLYSGGSAVPPSLIDAYERDLRVPLIQLWGMTELSPLGTLNLLKPHQAGMPQEQRLALLNKQGYPVPLTDVRVANADGKELPWDGEAVGQLQVRGPSTVRRYFRSANASDLTADGWFDTGDLATLTPEGNVQIVDRAKDLIKSGGEWISSVDIELALMAHPAVLEAAVIAAAHPTFMERPLALVVPRPGQERHATKDELLRFLSTRVAKWWLPDDVVFVKEIPKTSVGKFDKKVLRTQYQNHLANRAKL